MATIYHNGIIMGTGRIHGFLVDSPTLQHSRLVYDVRINAIKLWGGSVEMRTTDDCAFDGLGDGAYGDLRYCDITIVRTTLRQLLENQP